MYQETFDEDIKIYDYKFSNTKKAMCYIYENIKAIALDKDSIESKVEEKILLCEELSHYQTGSLYCINSMYNKSIYRSNRLKYEAKAKRYSIEKILPVSSIKDCLNKNIVDIPEMSEVLQVPEDFLIYAINMYIAKNQLSCNARGGFNA